MHQRIKTTLNKAKATRPLAERLVSWAKINTLVKKRESYKVLGDHALVSLLFDEIGPRFKNRTGGYVRVIRLGVRRGDNAQMALLEFTEIKKEVKEHRKEKEAKKETPKPQEAKERPVEEKALPKTEVHVSERPPIEKKPPKKFLGGLRKIFKKERDSL
jgi:large subunit ribosomal protein L17